MTATSSPAEEEVIAPSDEQTRTRGGLRLIHLWAIVPLAIAWFAGSIDYIEPFDFWWNLKSGEIMAQTGQFLATDVLVWSPVREPYYNPQWGSQILFYWIFSASPYLLLTLRAVIITASVGLLLWLCNWRSGSLRIASIATIVAYLTAWTNLGVRPQLFAFLPFLGFLFLLERKDAYPKWLPLLVPIMLFWVNVHGSFVLGVAMIGIYALGTIIEKVGTQEGRKWLRSSEALWQAGWMGVGALTSLANPYFINIYHYFVVATNDPVARATNIEWQPPTLNGGTGMLFFVNVFILLLSFYVSRRRVRPTEALLMLAFGYLSLTSLRNVMWWGWVTAPILAANLAEWAIRRRTKDEGRRTKDDGYEVRTGSQQPAASSQSSQQPRRQEISAFNWLIAGVLVGGALLFTPLWRDSSPFVPASAKAALSDDTPVELAEFLKEELANGTIAEPLFNYLEWGGYLGWALFDYGPPHRHQMFVDGRFEARQVKVWEDYLSVSRGRADWQQTLDHYGIRTLILNKEFHKYLLPFVAQSNTWKKVYEDKAGVVYVR
jgi:hypothetical protein